MNTVLTFLLTILAAGVALAQESGEKKEVKAEPKQHLSLIISGSIGNFTIQYSEFNKIYSNRSVSRIYLAGIGDGDNFLFGKYRQQYAHGASIVQNADVEGYADWIQRFYSIGARISEEDLPLYVDLAYVMSDAEENITTKGIQVPELTTQWKVRSQGFGAGIGVMIHFPKPFRIFGEVEYTSMLKSGRNPSGRAVPQIGGICVSGGLLLKL